jgi:undecaprenyl-diphosphatase
MSRIETALTQLQHWDASACARANRSLRYPMLRHVFRAASRLGDGVFWYALMLALLLRDARTAALPVLHMLLVGIACSTAYKLLKRRTLRSRPCEALQSVEAGIAPLDRFSFPSGHTLHAVAFSLVALAYYPVLAPLLVPFAALVAASRVALGLHYPTDVLAGAALGALLAALSLALR